MDSELQRIVDLQDAPKKSNMSSTWPLLGMLGGLVLTGIMIFGGKDHTETNQAFKWPWESTNETETEKPVLGAQALLNFPEAKPLPEAQHTEAEHTEAEHTEPSFTKPELCFDPINLDDTVKISQQVTTFYIVGVDKKLKTTSCFSNSDLQKILKAKTYLFQRCASNTRPDLDSYSHEDGQLLRKLPLQYNIFVAETDAKQIVLGKQYIVTPTQTVVGKVVNNETPTLCAPVTDVVYKITRA